jgi:hypothetical protein
MMSTSFLVHPLRIIAFVELDSDEEASTFRKALPQGEHKMAVFIDPSTCLWEPSEAADTRVS